MYDFEYQPTPSRFIFGSGTLPKVFDELERRGLSRALVLSTPQQVSHAENVKRLLRDKFVGMFTEAMMHTPVEVTERAIAYARDIQADALISIGGGSTVGLGKAISFRTQLYHLAIPTTYAGSEATPILGETKDGLKTTMSDPAILPDTVIYDADLTLSLPTGLSATSGVNAIAHAVEALYAQNTNPIICLMAQEGVKALAESLPVVVQNPSSRDARSNALYGAWLCGMCLGSVGMSLHHKLCHTLGGSFNLPHAETHTVVLPHALAYNAPAVPESMKILASVSPDSDGDAIKGLNILLNRLGVRRALKELGMNESDVDSAAEIALSKPYWNPRAIEKAPIRELIRRAWAGDEAKADL